MNQGIVVQTPHKKAPMRQILTMIGEADGRKNINHKELTNPLNTAI